MSADSSPPPPETVTALLQAWGRGDGEALDALVPLLERELHRLAAHQMRGERAGHTLQPTALVNEAYLRLVGVTRIEWRNRAHFLAVAARTMRRVLIDLARAKDYQKRGGRQPKLSLDDVDIAAPGLGHEVVAVHDALEALARQDVRKAQVVELRFFGGLTVEETAAVLDVSPETVHRDWKFARAWLLHALDDEAPDGAPPVIRR